MIPRSAHFVWLGRDLHWLYGMALRSAALRGGFERVLLHHDEDLERTAGWKLAAETPGFESRRIDPEALFRATGPRGDDLARLYRSLSQPAARSNMLRLAILATEGGVYLDTDTVTVRSFEPLLGDGFFCGAERIALPAALSGTRSPKRWVPAAARLAVRDLLRRLPSGWRLFRHCERFYPAVVNNAVVGSEPGHPLTNRLLDRMLELSARRRRRRFALGTHLLEETLAAVETPAVSVCEPHRFYPLGPEISQHWFKKKPEKIRVADVIHDETICVHWYASVRVAPLLPTIDEDFVRRYARRRLICELVEPLLAEGAPPRGAAR